jgi:chemotaxis protein MotB
LRAKLKKMQEANLNFELQFNEKRVKLILKEAVLFDSGSAELKEQAKRILKGVIDELKKLPNDIIVEGHTDNVPIRGGIYRSNFELSMARAYSVIKFMQDEGIDPKRLSGIGYGEYKPIADNSTQEGRAKNRRIEISILKVD